MKRIAALTLSLVMLMANVARAEPQTKLLIAAAASLENAFTQQLIPMFEAANPGIEIEGTYDSSGKLQTQLEAGLEADVFMSAAMKQMDALKDEGLIDSDTVVELLENRIVLIERADADSGIASFADIVNAYSIALGDPESVPAGQYAKAALSSIGVYDVLENVSFGTNVTEVLAWVAEGSADVGIVYATDATSTDKVKIIAEAPEGSLAAKVIYPVGIVSGTRNREDAEKFVAFLKSEAALEVFAHYGFASNAK